MVEGSPRQRGLVFSIGAIKYAKYNFLYVVSFGFRPYTLSPGHNWLGTIAVRSLCPVEPLEERAMTFCFRSPNRTPFSGNPIDLVEEIVIANDWAHDRAARRVGCRDFRSLVRLRLYFVWQEEICAMHFSCGF